MKLLIAYASKNGVSKRCAEMLVSYLPKNIEADIADLCQESPELAGYDAVVAGGSIRVGRFNKKLRAFLKNNKKSLSDMPCALYICCGLSHMYDEYRETQVPRYLELSLGVHHFGGELKPDKLSGFDKMVVRFMRKSITQGDFEDDDAMQLSLPEIIPENIKLLVERLKSIK